MEISPMMPETKPLKMMLVIINCNLLRERLGYKK
jgi:hypothetical protein